MSEFPMLHKCTAMKKEEAHSFLKMDCVEVYSICGVVLISAAQQNDSVIHTYTFFFMFFLHSGL